VSVDQAHKHDGPFTAVVVTVNGGADKCYASVEIRVNGPESVRSLALATTLQAVVEDVLARAR
jgi:hypothetical protein